MMRALILLLALTLPWSGAARAQSPLTIDTRPQTDTTLSLSFQGPAVEDAAVDGNEVVTRFAAGIVPQRVDQVVEAHAEWIETIEYGYDSLVIRFAPGIQVLLEKTDAGVTIFASRPDAEEVAPAPAAAVAQDPQRIRLNYYRALALIESGAIADGRAILVQLLRDDPRNIEVMLLLAQAEERLGRPRRAVVLYDKVLALDPNLPFAIRDRQRLARDLADTARFSYRYQDIENGETQVISTLDGRVSRRDGLALEYMLENRTMEAGAVTRRDGTIERFEGDRQRGSFTLRPARQGAVQPSASLYASNQVAGASVAVDLDHGNHSIGVDARWSEPTFNFVEGIIDGGARDRVAADWQWQYVDTYELSASGALNRYTLDGDHAGAGVAVTLEARRRLPVHWLLSTVGYRLDAEYITNAQDNPAAGADLLPLSSREGHTLDATAERAFGDYVRAQGLAGYTFDRLNGGGPLAEVNLIYEPLVDLEITTTLGTSISESRGTQNQLFYGGLSVRTRF